MQLMDVVLPEPLGPSRPKISPGAILRLKFDVDDVCHEAALLLLAARYDCIIAGAAGAHQ